MDTAQLRLCFLDVLKNMKSGQLNVINREIVRHAVNRDFIQRTGDPSQWQPDASDIEKVRELFWAFIIQGVIIPGMNANNPNLPFFSVTEYGQKVVDSPDPVPHDPDGYIAHLDEVAPNLNPIAKSYIAEGLECFQRATYTAAVVMLGVASERLILDLADSVANKLTGKERDNLARKLSGTRITVAYEETMKRLRPRLGGLPDSLSDGFEGLINGVFNVIRRHRNEAGHPSGDTVDRLTALGLFSSFPLYCGRVSKVIEHIDSNGLS